MSAFTLDTTGIVALWRENRLGVDVGPTYWTDLDPFTQGYVEALFAGTRELAAERCAVRDGWKWSPAYGGYIHPDYRCAAGDGPTYEVASDADGACNLADLGPIPFTFSDLSPEALALILKDCEAYKRMFAPAVWTARMNVDPISFGQGFWRARQRGNFPTLAPPLTVHLGDDGKVHLAVAAQ